MKKQKSVSWKLMYARTAEVKQQARRKAMKKQELLHQGRPTFLSDEPYLFFKNFRGP